MFYTPIGLFPVALAHLVPMRRRILLWIVGSVGFLAGCEAPASVVSDEDWQQAHAQLTRYNQQKIEDILKGHFEVEWESSMDREFEQTKFEFIETYFAIQWEARDTNLSPKLIEAISHLHGLFEEEYKHSDRYRYKECLLPSEYWTDSSIWRAGKTSSFFTSAFIEFLTETYPMKGLEFYNPLQFSIPKSEVESVSFYLPTNRITSYRKGEVGAVEHVAMIDEDTGYRKPLEARPIYGGWIVNAGPLDSGKYQLEGSWAPWIRLNYPDSNLTKGTLWVY